MTATDGPAADPVVVGVDYGTLSGRAVVVRVSDGAELGSAVTEYAHAVVDRALPGSGRSLPPDWALQVPSDYLDVLRDAVPRAVRAAGVDPSAVVGIGTDFTACTVLPVLDDGTPLCELPELADRPHAYVKLWKHHAAQGQADRINALAASARQSRGSAATAASCRRSGSWPRGCSCSRRTPRSTSAPSTGSRRPTGSSGSCAAPTSATPAPPATRPCCRTGPTPPGSSSAPSTRGSRTSSRTRSGSRSERSATAPAV